MFGVEDIGGREELHEVLAGGECGGVDGTTAVNIGDVMCIDSVAHKVGDNDGGLSYSGGKRAGDGGLARCGIRIYGCYERGLHWVVDEGVAMPSDVVVGAYKLL